MRGLNARELAVMMPARRERAAMVRSPSAQSHVERDQDLGRTFERARHLSPQRSDSLPVPSETLNHKRRSTLLFALSAISSVYFGRTTN
jgi:hypothetical protein